MIEVEIFLNDQSLHGQFHSRHSFRAALARLMTMRRVARRFEREIHCHSAILSQDALQGMVLQKAIDWLSQDERRAVMQWWTQGGPFWAVDRRHGADDWFECRDEIVTDDALGEAAYRAAIGIECDMVSFTPSDWTVSPLAVTWRREAEGLEDRRVTIQNFWEVEELSHRLQSAAPPLLSWSDLRTASERQFVHLTFGSQCFDPLKGLPFSGASATRIRALLSILDRFAVAFGPDGRRSGEGQRIYQDYFMGKHAPFSDSSGTEKREFAKDLSFRHPDRPGEALPCTWHGKVRHMTLRIHFSWPIRPDKPLYVMYIGQKITRR